MSSTLRIKPGLLADLRAKHSITSEHNQARLIGVDRTTLRRIDAGDTPSAAFIAGFTLAFDMPIHEAFEVVEKDVPEPVPAP